MAIFDGMPNSKEFWRRWVALTPSERATFMGGGEPQDLADLLDLAIAEGRER